MTESTFIKLLRTNKPLVADGATGTNLIERGLPSGVTAENWVLDNPEMIIQLHKDFILAGADILLTCTFNGSPVRLQNTPLADKVNEVNHRAVELARKAAEGSSTLVAGSIGPLGQLLKPLGPLTTDEAQKSYAEQARILSKAGVDLLVIETQYDLGEIKAAIQGVRSVTDLPLVASLSYDRGKRTMMGVRPSQAANELEGLSVDLIGINCGKSLEENLENLVELRQATSMPIWFKPNAGLPRVNELGKTIYETTPAMMGALTPSWIEAGANIVGGCCGTSPQHLREIARQVKKA
jgi:5-methyltetrahydrofolate--homocysteine methyltransferase